MDVTHNQKRSQKPKHNNNYYNFNFQRQQQQQQQQQVTSVSSVTGAVSGTSTQLNNSNNTKYNTNYNNNNNNNNEYYGIKKKYKYNTYQQNTQSNGTNVYNYYSQLTSKRFYNDQFYNRNRRSYLNKQKRYSNYSNNSNSYDNQYNYQRYNNNNNNQTKQFYSNSKYQSNTFIQFSPTQLTLNPFNNNNNNNIINLKTFPYDYAQLPNVVLAKIYSYLSLEDRLNASTTCKNWRSGLLNNPCLWTSFDLVIYLCNKQTDFKSAQFKLKHFAKLIKNLSFKFDVDDLILIEKLVTSLEQIKYEPSHIRYLTLQPVYNANNNNDVLNNSINCTDYSNDDLKLRLFKSLKELVSNSKCIEHLALGFLNDYNRNNLIDLLNELYKKHQHNLKSLHISSVKKAVAFYLSKHSSFNKHTTTANNHAVSSIMLNPISQLLDKFNMIQHLSIDYSDLTDELIRCNMFTSSLKKLNLNVNSLTILNETKNAQRNDAWLYTVNRNSQLRVAINVLVQEEFARKYNSILSSNMPLETLRMYFCKSLNPEIIQYLSDNYSETLQSLHVVDSIVEPTLRYHNPLRFDADPDPLILLCWKCKNLKELVIVGYEMLEINLIAIAKLRTNLKKFHVAMDCIIDLKYGKFRNDDFIEDDEGEDTIVDYGFCSDHVIDSVSKILGSQNWHPLEKEELSLSIYDVNVPYEEAYLDTLSKEQY